MTNDTAHGQDTSTRVHQDPWAARSRSTLAGSVAALKEAVIYVWEIRQKV